MQRLLRYFRLSDETKYYLLFGFLVLQFYFLVFKVFAQSAQEGFYTNYWQAKTIISPAYISASPTNLTPTATVVVDAGTILTKVSKYVYGNNAAAFDGKIENNHPLIQNINDLNPHVIRWPGGNMSNNYFWDAKDSNSCPRDLPPGFVFNPQFYGANKTSWTMPLDSFYTLLANTNSEASMCVNYAYARYSTSANPMATAAHYAAQWVRYDKGRTKIWEIGNENYGFWETGYTINTAYNEDGQPTTITGDLYGKHCVVFIDSMKAAAKQIGNDIKIGVVVSASNNSASQTWNQGVLTEAASKADFLIVHNYMASNTDTNLTTILTSAAVTPSNTRNLLNGQVRSYANMNPMPMAMTEWNINPMGNKQQVSFVNGIHGALMLGELIKNQYGQANRWDFLNGWANGDSQGLFANGETDVTNYSPRAPFYYLYYFQKFFGDNMVSSTVTGDTNTRCYASTFSSGQSGVVLVNKGSTQQVVKLQMKNFNTGNRYYYYVLTGGKDNGNFSRKVYVNGQTTTEAGGGPSNYATLLPYGTTANGAISLVVPKYGVVYILVENNLVTSLEPEQNSTETTYSLYPNPVKNQLTIQTTSNQVTDIQILNVLGDVVFQDSFTGNTSSKTWNVGSLSNGVHFVKISNGYSEKVVRFIKE